MQARLAPTIEIGFAVVHLMGKQAGMVEVPIFLRGQDAGSCDLDKLLLEVDGETQPLTPIRSEYSGGRLRLMYDSRGIRDSGRLPDGLRLLWGFHRSQEAVDFGMELRFKAASD